MGFETTITEAVYRSVGKWFEHILPRKVECYVNCYSSEGKVSLMEVSQLWREKNPGNQEPRTTTRSHHSTNLTKIYWERHKVAASAWVRSIRELNMSHAYIGFWLGVFQGRDFKPWAWSEPRDWWDFVLRDWWVLVRVVFFSSIQKWALTVYPTTISK